MANYDHAADDISTILRFCEKELMYVENIEKNISINIL
jgi:hypothetical protein